MRRTRQRALGLLALGLLALAVAACGGSGDARVVGQPTLRSTPLPTVPWPTPTPATCDPDVALELPPDMPEVIPIPPGYVVWSIERSPHLRVVGRVYPPEGITTPPEGFVTNAIVSWLRMQENWRPQWNERTGGVDYDITAPDGRVLNINAWVPIGCGGQVELTYNVRWIESGEDEPETPDG